MEGEPITDTESESESDWDPESSTEYDSLSENDREKKGKQGGKRKIRKRTYSSQNLRQTTENKLELPVTCGAKDGVLYVEKYNDMQACIFSEGQWFKPDDFESFGGKARSKKWRNSILYNDIPLRELIKDGLLLPFKKCRVQNKQEKHLQSPPMVKRKRIYAPKEEMTDQSVFQAPSLPVTCVSLTGTLYKIRFASGSRGKCIRTEESWFTPEEFVKQEPTLTDGHWKKDILCHGKTLNFLLKKQILRIHSLLCECMKCSDQPEDLMAQNNDDVCYVCHSEGVLVCCDECPRAFHSHCHLPAVDGDSPGEWICTFCVLRTSQQWRESSSMTEQEAFNAPVSKYRLHCHYLLLCVYKEDIKRVFVKDPRKTVTRYSQFISQPMWLDRIKLKLESDEYQTVEAFVSDFQLIFSNCSTYNRDNKFGEMGARLKEMFEKEFQKIFTIQ